MRVVFGLWGAGRPRISSSADNSVGKGGHWQHDYPIPGSGQPDRVYPVHHRSRLRCAAFLAGGCYMQEELQPIQGPVVSERIDEFILYLKKKKVIIRSTTEIGLAGNSDHRSKSSTSLFNVHLN